MGLKTYAEAVNRRMEELLPFDFVLPAALHQAMRYSALAPGKRLRPALLMESARACGGDPLLVLDGACAVEFVHAFSLIHDDLPALDNDDLRRGRPTCHVKFGEATAILAGDALFALAFQVLAEGDFSADARVDALSRLSRASIRLVRGETLDLLSEGQPGDAGTLGFIHRNKTGALVACACAMGGLLGGGSSADVEALDRYGESVGLAFQIADDILNETATPEALGKATGSDQERGKQTYPAVFGLERSREMASEAVGLAIACLESLSGPTAVLSEFARYAVNRTS